MKNVRWMLAVVATTLVACGGDDDGATPQQPQPQPQQPQPPPPPPSPNAVASVTISGGPLQSLLGLGESHQYSVTLKNDAGETLTDRTVTWMSSAPDLVSISQTGVARGLSPGTTTLTAMSEGKSAVATVNVSSNGYMRIGAETYSLQPGRSVQLTARALDTSLQPQVVNVIWMSSEPAVASVSLNGLLTAHSLGTTTITATFGQFSESARFGVQQPVLGKIAFHSSRVTPGILPYLSGGLYLMNTDGSNPTLMIADYIDICSPTVGQCVRPWSKPTWTRDGMRIAASSTRRYAVENSGRLIFLCTTSNAFCDPIEPFPTHFLRGREPVPLQGERPAWSPDGRHIAYSAFSIGLWSAVDYRLGKVPSNEPTGVRSVAWSPDGTRLAAASDHASAGTFGPIQTTEIWVVNSDGTAPMRLTNNGVNDDDPVWSPDGTRIAFTSERSGNREIFLMNADGTAPVNVTNHSSDDASPTWSPDGSRIAFHSSRDGNFEIYVIDADGSDPHNLTNDAANDMDPAWGPQ